ncbi:metal ABC transporter permease [Planctomycetota bacterium]
MSDAVRFFLLQLTLIGVVLIMHTYLGLHIIRRVLVFSDLALAQLAALGALVGVLLVHKCPDLVDKYNLDLAYGSMGSYVLSLFTVLAGALVLALVKPKARLIPREAVIGITYALALIASLMVTDKYPGGDADMLKTLTGYMAWVNWKLVGVTVSVYIALLILHYIFRKQFIAITDNPQQAKNIKFWDFLFFATQGIITVLIVPVAGVFLAFVFLMLPATVAVMFTKKWGAGLLLGWLVGFVACTLGLSLSYRIDWPYGPSLVLSMGIFFFAAILIRSRMNKRKPLYEKGTN